MDQGVIQNLKVHYRRRMIMKHIQAVDFNTQPQITVLDGIRLLAAAWRCVSAKTIANCFSHAGFRTDCLNATNDDFNNPDSDDSDDEDQITLARLLNMPCSFEDYTRVDAELRTGDD